MRLSLLVLIVSALAVGCSTNQVHGPVLSEDAIFVTGYASDAMKAAQLLAQYPAHPEVADEAGSAVLNMQVTRSGAIKSVSITQSTGFAGLDAEATKSVWKLVNLPSIPEQIMSGRNAISFPVVVTLDMPSGSSASVSTLRVVGRYGKGDAFYSAASNRVSTSLEYPAKSYKAGEAGFARVIARIARDGTISRVVLVQSTERAYLDAESVAVFARIGKMPPLPDSVAPKAPYVDLEFPVNYYR